MKLIYILLVISALITRTTRSCKTSEQTPASSDTHKTPIQQDSFPAEVAKVQAADPPPENVEDVSREPKRDDDAVRPKPKVDDHHHHHHHDHAESVAPMPHDLNVIAVYDKSCKLRWKPPLHKGKYPLHHYKIYKLEAIEGAEPVFLGQIYPETNQVEFYFSPSGLTKSPGGHYFQVEAVYFFWVVKTGEYLASDRLQTNEPILVPEPSDSASSDDDKSSGHDVQLEQPISTSNIKGHVAHDDILEPSDTASISHITEKETISGDDVRQPTITDTSEIEKGAEQNPILDQEPRASRPLKPRITKASSGHELHWQPPTSSGRSKITGYAVEERDRTQGWIVFLEINEPKTSTKITLKHSKYRLRVRARNDAGLGEPSKIVHWSKQKYGCGHIEEAVTVSRRTSSRTFMSWHNAPWNMHMQVLDQCDQSIPHPTFACAKSHQCGLMLVRVHDDLEGSNVLVTSARCVVEQGTNDKKYEMGAIRIIAQISTLADKTVDALTHDHEPENEHDAIVFKVEDVLPHPDYNHETLENNIALVRVNELIDLDDHMRAICVTESTGTQDSASTIFKMFHPTGKDKMLQNVGLLIHKDQHCEKLDSRTEFSFKKDEMFCGGWSDDEKFCLTDMGRGVACKPAGSKHNHDPWTLCGLTNYVIPDSKEDHSGGAFLSQQSINKLISVFFSGSQKCSQDAVFTRVNNAHASWIKKEIVEFSGLLTDYEIQ